MGVTISKSFSSGRKDHVIIVPCLSSGDAVRALKLLDVSGADAFIADFDANCDEPAVFYAAGQKVTFIGLGKASTFVKQRQPFHILSGKLRTKNINACSVLLAHLEADPARISTLADAAVNGLFLGRYEYGLLKTQIEGSSGLPEFEIQVITGEHAADYAIRIAENAAASQLAVCEIINLPSSHKTPATIAEWATASAARGAYEVEVLDEKQLVAQGFHALLAVNRGSEFPARLVVTKYAHPQAKDAPLIALIGKGVTFDTGGVSLKSGDSVHLMKSDMSGAAAVLGAVDLLARMKAPVRVIACAPCTDNNIGTRSINPGDVIGSYSGKTIEVINTDAEGRLILADALSYVDKKYHPDVIIDVATLTGSIARALGTYCAGLFTQSDTVADALIAAGDQTSERLWRMPMYDDYAEEMKSDIADIKNLSDKPSAGAISAAKFLEYFVPDHKAWAHLDIAGVAFKANGVSKNHTATAFGVRLLYEFVTGYAAK